MDALITKDGVETKLSSIGLLVTDFQDSSPTVSVNKREVANRNGYIQTGAVFKQKRITVSGTFLVSSALALEEKKDEINGLISNDEPFYITKMFPTVEMYNFELPGEKVHDLDLLNIPHKAYKYRYKVMMENEIAYTFQGKTSAGLRMNFSFDLGTAELPFGETIPVDETVNGFINYAGTAKCSQLEHPWELKLTASEEQSGSFNVKVGNRNFTFSMKEPLKKDSVLLLKGVETIFNGINVNQMTNYEFFVLEKMENNQVPIITNFKGTIEALNKKEFYK